MTPSLEAGAGAFRILPTRPKYVTVTYLRRVTLLRNSFGCQPLSGIRGTPSVLRARDVDPAGRSVRARKPLVHRQAGSHRMPPPMPRRTRPNLAPNPAAATHAPAATGARHARPANRAGPQWPAPQPCRPIGPAGTGHGRRPSPQRRSHAAPPDRRLRPDAQRSHPPGACPQQPRTSTTRQRPAFGHSPRHSSNVSSTSAVDTSEGRRPVRASHCATEGRAANRAASRRSNSGTVIPSSAARRTNAAYTSSSMSRI